MILTDASVIIGFLKAPSQRIKQIIQGNQAAICGVTIAEVLAGARSPAQLQKLKNALTAFARLPILETFWTKLGENQSALGGKGVVVPLADTLLATVAIEHDVELWTYDAHFAMMQSVLPQLRLFQEPP